MICTAVIRSSSRSLKPIAPFVCLALLCVPGIVRSQDAVRPSLAGEAASEARQQDITRIPYNLLVGPVRFRVSATMGVEFNDNINLSQSDKQSDVIFRPQVNFDAIWPITQLNTLQFDIGMSYAVYAQHSSDDTNGVLISPGSRLAFDIFIGDFRINIHELPSLQQDPIAEVQLNNTADYGRFENTAGISVLWDLNKVLVTLAYDHYNFVSTTSEFDYLNRNAEILAGTVSVAVASNTNVGIESNSVYSYYNQNVMNDSLDAAIGGFVETQISSYLKLRAAAGYQWINFDDTGSVDDSSDLSSYYVNVLISNRLNANISQSVSAGHETQLGVNSNYITLTYVRYTTNWTIIRNTMISTEFFYEDGQDSGGFIDEHLQRYGAAVSLGYQLTPHVTLGLRYQYTQKQSDVAGRDYKQNRVSLDGTYSF